MFNHITVLKAEAVEGLHIDPQGIYVDCTLGGAGHSELILSKLQAPGKLIAFDQDDTALSHAAKLFADQMDRVILVKSNFRYLKERLLELDLPTLNGQPQVNGILFDLGVSSPQLDDAERGFSYNQDAPLDMRMDQEGGLSAHEVVNQWSAAELTKILFEYGEEKFARRIASQIVTAREKSPINTTFELAEIVKNAIPAAARRTGPHPAKRSFQAIRIAVNDELVAMEEALEQAVHCLAPGGRIAVITFHSLEDRICKHLFAKFIEQCTCPSDFPMCVCKKKSIIKLVQRKPILPSEAEIELNNRSRSAKLRIAEKI
jgi:16S rRNA (cytosine1402-N4)-methyltransferase